tara:strand:+ start:389 stop:586 length:198 start_codon:yes stop_codon:yes gene_type:complete
MTRGIIDNNINTLLIVITFADSDIRMDRITTCILVKMLARECVVTRISELVCALIISEKIGVISE